MNNRKTKLIIIACLCVAVLGLSIGYALLSTRLNITGTAKVPASKWDVVFLKDEIQTTETGTAKCNIGTVEGTSISGMSVTFNKPGDACVFSIPVENTGNISAKLVDVTGKSSNLTFVGSGSTALSDQDLLQSNVIYEVNYGDKAINGKTDFSSIDLLKANNKVTVTLRVTFNHSAEDIPKNPVTLGGLDRGFIFESLTKEEGNSQTGSSLDNIPNPPELNGDMIPVYYEATSPTEGTWKKADVNNENNNWYDYSNQKWANAVTIVSGKRNEIKEAPAGIPININDINTMWVWIPRYSYTIKSENGGANYFGKASSENKNPSQALPGEIDVKFISKVTETGSAQYTGNTPTNWRTNEAFDFGREKRSGIWVGKFETTGTLANACTNESCVVSSVTIKPEVASLRAHTVSSFFYAARSMQRDTSTFGFSTTGDLHMIKNDEWGAVAYLSQSKYGKYGNSNYTGANKEIYQNKSEQYITGNSNGTPSQSETRQTQYLYNDMTDLGKGQGQAGLGASTTGNIYGVYDMSGGAFEYVMGVLAYYEDGSPMSGNSAILSSGFAGKIYQSDTDTYVDFTNSVKPLIFPNEKYYNLYNVSTTKDGMPTISDLKNSVKACSNGVCYGQALSETLGWYGDYTGFVYREAPWSARGGSYSDITLAGVFHSTYTNGNAYRGLGSRFVLTP